MLAALGIAETAFRSALVCTAFDRAIGSVGGGGSAYNARSGEVGAEAQVSAVGGVQSPYGGKPP